MSASLRALTRTTTRRIAIPARPYHTTVSLRLPYKDSMDRESLRPGSTENTKTGRDQDLASSDAAFDPNKTSPEAEGATTDAETGPGENPLEGSGANQELSKPRGDEKSGNDRGVGKEIGKGGRSSGHSAKKNGSPSKA